MFPPKTTLETKQRITDQKSMTYDEAVKLWGEDTTTLRKYNAYYPEVDGFIAWCKKAVEKGYTIVGLDQDALR